MKTTTRALVALLGTALAVPAFAQSGAPAQQQAPAQPQIRASKQAMKALGELQAAVKSNDQAAIAAKAAAAQAVVSTKEDRYILAQLQLQAAVAAKDNAAMAKAIDAVAATGMVDAAKTSQLYLALGGTLYAAKQFDPAAAAFERALAANPNNADAMINLAETRFSQGRKADAVSSFQRAIQAKVAAGQKPADELYKRALGIAYDANLPQSADLARQWVAAYPNPDSWRNSIAIYRNINHPDADSAIDLMRLMRVTDAMATPADFAVYLNALGAQSNYIEAQTVLEKAVAANRFNASDPQLKEVAANLKAKPKVTAADLDSAAKSAGTPNALLHIGDRFYGLGEYSKAVEVYKKAGAKGIDANLVNERVGVALATAGDKAGATAALKAVTGARTGVAQLWLLFLQTQG